MLEYVPQRGAAASARAWLFLIFLLPLPGVVLYALIGQLDLFLFCRGLNFFLYFFSAMSIQ
ncbi:MAG: hypothetical protein EHM79_17545 [Geobacter sp.]|nr:MAG: hypothetical protein EHM79_17545 [Geobacter sp.]